MGGEEAEEVDVSGADGGDVGFALVAVDPEWGEGGFYVVGEAFEAECVLAVGHYEEDAGDHGADAALSGGVFARLFWEEDGVDFVLELEFELKFSAGFDCEPGGRIHNCLRRGNYGRDGSCGIH